MRAVVALLVLACIPFAWSSTSAHGAMPEALRVSFGEDPRTQATIMWTTTGDAATLVQYGPTSALGWQAEGRSFLAPGSARFLHEARLDELAPGSVVHYRVGDGASWSTVRSFSTAPAGASFRFVALGDHGRTAQSAATVEAVAARDPAFALIVGDLSYASGSAERWDEWARIVEPLASEVPLLAAPGNHEDEGVTLGTSAFRERLALPGRELYYGFDVGRVHFLVLHSTLETAQRERDFAPMIAFAETDLARAAARRDAGELDFLIVAQHHPLYGNHKEPTRHVEEALVALEEPWLQRFGVDLLLVGHNHFYERSFPMAFSVPTSEGSEWVGPTGYVQVTTGGGGKSMYEFVDPNDFASWSAAHARRYHYVEFDVQPGVLTARAISTDDEPGQVLDSFTLRT